MTIKVALTVAIVSLVLEVGGLILWLDDLMLAAALTHAVVAVAANVVTWRHATTPNAALATVRMTAIMLPFLGPIAPALATLLLAAQLVRPYAVHDAAEWHEHLFPNLAADPINEQIDAIGRHQPGSQNSDEIESFYDVLRWGKLPEKEHVLSLISRSYRPEFAPVLREALGSDDLGLRAQAAAGLSLLETRTSVGLATLQQTWRDAPTEARRVEAAVALAQALSTAAHSSLYDEVRTTEIRREIVALLRPIVAAGSSDPARAAMLSAILGRTMIQLGDVDAAVVTLEPVVAASEHAEAAFGWLIEALFRKSDFTGLTALIARRRDLADALVRRDGPLAPALAFWATR